MKKTLKSETGITLVALVITIIIMLILVAVVIYSAFGNNGLIARAKEARDKWEQEQDYEMSLGNEVDDLLNELGIGGGKKPLAPDGFIPSDKPEEETVEDGYVIENPSDGSEFVWVPVPFAVCAESELATTIATNKYPIAVELANGDYKAVLYEFTREAGALKIEAILTDPREPDVIDSEDGNGIENIKSILNMDGAYQDIMDAWGDHLQEEFNSMVESVKRNKGFYIGKYETSIKSGTGASAVVQSIAGEDAMTGAGTSGDKWWGMYVNQKEYAQRNGLTDVTSAMIWGCQWDQVMIWMRTEENTLDSSGDSLYILNSHSMGWHRNNSTLNSTRETGKPVGNSENRVKNIYDLGGNVWEWTQEAKGTRVRTTRGGYSGSNGNANGGDWPAKRNTIIDTTPNEEDTTIGSRMILLIK